MQTYTPNNKPTTTGRIDQEPLTFQNDPGEYPAQQQAFRNEVIARSDEFPILYNFTLYVIDYRNEQSHTSQVATGFYTDATTGKWIIDWEAHKARFPMPEDNEVIYEMQLGYQTILVANDAYVFIMESTDEDIPRYLYYAKVPRSKFVAQTNEVNALLARR